MKEEIQFKLGDSVYFPYHGYGTIIGLHNDGREYPIEVRWEASPHGQEVNTFTKDGFLTHCWAERNVPSDSKLRDQLTVVDKSPLKKAEEMAEESKFKVGDRVYAPFHDRGIVTKITNDDTYPIEVKWDVSRFKIGEDISTFTPDGFLFLGDKTDNTHLTKVKKFHVGDTVFSPHFGEGTIKSIDESKWSIYPIHVEWKEELQPYHVHSDIFTIEGLYTVSNPCHEYDIISKGEAEKMGMIHSVINNNLSQYDSEKVDAKDEKFHVGDRVFSFHYGIGVVECVDADAGSVYPVLVRWTEDSKFPSECDCFTKNGVHNIMDDKCEMDIFPLTKEGCLVKVKDADEGTIERMEDGLNKKVEDAINPSHYRVEGLPDAIDIINHLMHREQYEGFLWGNIIKYAYRYGRKGDKAETAGKIAWYAQMLKELGECESK